MMVNADVNAIYLGHARTASRDTYAELPYHGFQLVGHRHWNMADSWQQKQARQGVTDGAPEAFTGELWFDSIGGWAREWKYFTTIRNPYDTLLSWWCHDVLMQSEPFRPVELWWVQKLRDRAPHHFRQPGRIWRFLYDPGCWRVLRYETLTQDLARVLEELGLDPTLRRLHTPNPKTKTLVKPATHGRPERWWAPEALEWFSETYAEEIERTGYARTTH